MLKLPKLLVSNLEGMKELVKRKFDNVVVIDGMEGYGKTTLALIIASYLTEGRFTNKDIVFTVEEFEAWVDDKERKHGDAVVWDEFALAGMSADAMTNMQKVVIKKMVTIRKKGLHIILVIPYVFMLRKYFAIGRSRNLIHVYSTHGLDRGKFKFYSYAKKKLLYLRGIREWDYSRVAPDFRATFPDAPEDLIDFDAYEEHKDRVIQSITFEAGGDRPLVKRMKAQRNKLVLFMREELKIKQKDIAALLQLDRQTIGLMVKEARKDIEVEAHTKKVMNP